MSEFLSVVFGFPTIVYSLLLAVVLVYWLASRALPVWRRQPWAAGVVYGFLVYGVMTCAVLPLSRAGGGASPGWMMAANILIHIVCVGLPTALIVARSSRR